MPSARSRLADIEGPGLGKPLSRDDIDAAAAHLHDSALKAVAAFLRDVDADATQCEGARDQIIDALRDLIARSTARQLREIEEDEG